MDIFEPTHAGVGVDSSTRGHVHRWQDDVAARRAEARSMLQRGCHVRDVMAATGLSRALVYELKAVIDEAARAAERDRVRRLEAEAAAASAARIEASAARAALARAEERAARAREISERHSQEARDLRKGDAWYRRALNLGFAVGDLLPESWTDALVMDIPIRAITRQAEIPASDREVTIVLEAEAREVLREVLAARAAEECDSLVTNRGRCDDPQARRERFGRFWRDELYEPDPTMRSPRSVLAPAPTTPAGRRTPGARR